MGATVEILKCGQICGNAKGVCDSSDVVEDESRPRGPSLIAEVEKMSVEKSAEINWLQASGPVVQSTVFLLELIELALPVTVVPLELIELALELGDLRLQSLHLGHASLGRCEGERDWCPLED